MFKKVQKDSKKLENKTFTALGVDEMNQINGGMKGKVKWFNDQLGIWEEIEVEIVPA